MRLVNHNYNNKRTRQRLFRTNTEWHRHWPLAEASIILLWVTVIAWRIESIENQLNGFMHPTMNDGRVNMMHGIHYK